MSTQFPNRRWLVIPAELVETIDFSQILETSAETLRYSVDGTKTFVKYEVMVVTEPQVTTYIDAETMEEKVHTIEPGVYGRPSFWSEDYPEYGHAEMLDLLATEEWSAPINYPYPS